MKGETNKDLSCLCLIGEDKQIHFKKKIPNQKQETSLLNLHHVVANNSHILSKNQRPNINLQLLPGFNPNIALIAKPDGLIIIT